MRLDLEGRFSFDPTALVDPMEIESCRTAAKITGKSQKITFYPITGEVVTERGSITV